MRMERNYFHRWKGAFIKRGKGLYFKWGHLWEGTMDNYCKGQWELVKGKGVRVKIKLVLIRGGKGKGHFYKLIGALVKVKGALFLCKKGHFWGTWKVGGCAFPCPPPPPGALPLVPAFSNVRKLATCMIHPDRTWVFFFMRTIGDGRRSDAFAQLINHLNKSWRLYLLRDWQR